MANNNYFELPDLIELNSVGGDFHAFLEFVYNEFKKEFIDQKPVFRGQRLGLKKNPVSQEKEATFWHMTSEGEDENNRNPDIRRMERIKWPACIINGSEHDYLKVWENSRGTKNNILIFHEGENFVVVLRKGNGYLLPWTAYLVEHSARKRKLMEEYKSYINAKSAQQS